MILPQKITLDIQQVFTESSKLGLGHVSFKHLMKGGSWDAFKPVDVFTCAFPVLTGAPKWRDTIFHSPQAKPNLESLHAFQALLDIL